VTAGTRWLRRKSEGGLAAALASLVSLRGLGVLVER
jgi:hypothetical protein